MNKNNESSVKKIISLVDLDVTKKVDHESPASMKLKLVTDGKFTQLPSAIDAIHVPAGTVPSAFSSFECLKRLLIYLKKDVASVHPSNLLGRLQVLGNVAVGPMGVTSFIKEDTGMKQVPYEVKRGMLVPKDAKIINICSAITADLIVSSVSTTKTGDFSIIDKDLKRTGIPSLDLINQKKIWGDDEPNPVACRNLIYSRMILPDNALAAAKTHSDCGETLPNYKVSPGLTQAVNVARNQEYTALGKILPPPLEIKVCEMDVARPKYLSDLEASWMQFNARQAITGDLDPSKVYCGYNRFSMTSADAKILAVVQDILVVCKRYGSALLALNNRTDLSVAVINTLVANKITVLVKNTIQEKYRPDRPGLYAFEASLNKECVHYFHYSINDYYPKITANGVEHKSQLFKNLQEYACRASSHPKIFFYAVMNEALLNFNNYGIFPCVAAERMRVIMMKGVSESFTLKDMMKRSSIANYCKLNFPISRRPFWWVDNCREYLAYNMTIYLPRTVAVKEAADKYNLDMEAEEIEYPQIEADFSSMKIPEIENRIVPVLTPMTILSNVSEDRFLRLADDYSQMLIANNLSTEDNNEFSFLIHQYGSSITDIHRELGGISTSRKPFATWFASFFDALRNRVSEVEVEELVPPPSAGRVAPPVGSSGDTIGGNLFDNVSMSDDF